MAVFRVFGSHMTEVPLIATPPSQRRKGHARKLMDAFEGLLKPVHLQLLPLGIWCCCLSGCSAIA